MRIINDLSLLGQLLFDNLHSLLVLFIEVFEGLHDFEVLVGMKGLLEYSEVEEVYIGKAIAHDFVWQSLYHESDINLVA